MGHPEVGSGAGLNISIVGTTKHMGFDKIVVVQLPVDIQAWGLKAESPDQLTEVRRSEDGWQV